MPQLLLCTLSRALANHPQLYCRAAVLALAERETAEQQENLLRVLSAIEAVLLSVAYSGQHLWSISLALSPKQSLRKPLGDFTPIIYCASQTLQEKSDA